MIRHTAASPCGICGGWEALDRGHGVRCAGFVASNPDYVYCTRPESAGSLVADETTSPPAFRHFIGNGVCRCGADHGDVHLCEHAVVRDVAKMHPKITTAEVRVWHPRPRGDGSAGPGSRVSAIYPYRGADGQLVWRSVRYTLHGGGKTFRPEQPAEGGGWWWDRQGVEPIPFHLPELLAAPDRLAVVVEGEKDVLRLENEGLLATTFGSATSWSAEAGRWLHGRRYIAILADADADGERYAQAVEHGLRDHVGHIAIVRLPGLAEHGDASDWLARGHTGSELKALIADAFRRTVGRAA